MTVAERILELSPLSYGTVTEHLLAIVPGGQINVGPGTFKGNISKKMIPSTMRQTQKLSGEVVSGITTGNNEKTQKITGNISKKIIR